MWEILTYVNKNITLSDIPSKTIPELNRLSEALDHVVELIKFYCIGEDNFPQEIEKTLNEVVQVVDMALIRLSLINNGFWSRYV